MSAYSSITPRYLGVLAPCCFENEVTMACPEQETKEWACDRQLTMRRNDSRWEKELPVGEPGRQFLASACNCTCKRKRNETHEKGVGHRPGTLLHVGKYVPHTLVYGYVPPVHASVRTVVTRSHGLVSLGLLPETPPRSETTMQDGRWRDFFEHMHRITWLPAVRPGRQNVTVTALVAPNGVKRKDRFCSR